MTAQSPATPDLDRISPVKWDRTIVDVSLLILRVTAGVVFMAHGGQKMFGWFGGPGLAKVAEMMGTLGYFVSVGEFFGGLGLIVGFLTRFSAGSLIVIMLGAIFTVHGKNGFFLSDQGFEYNFTLIGLMLPILLAGPGRFGISQYLPLPKCHKTGRTIMPLE